MLLNNVHNRTIWGIQTNLEPCRKMKTEKKCEKTIVMHLHSWKLKDIVTQHEQSLCHLIPGYLWNRKVKKIQ